MNPNKASLILMLMEEYLAPSERTAAPLVQVLKLLNLWKGIRLVVLVNFRVDIGSRCCSVLL
jgi:hypothetical protein